MASYEQLLASATDQQIADAARAVAALIEEKGKATHTFVDNLGRICALEALKRSTVNIGVRTALLRALTHHTHRNIVDWNDDSTQEEVVKGFLQVADRIEARP